MTYRNTNWFDTPYRAISDRRLSDVRHVETDFPLKHFASLEAWEDYKSKLRDRLRFSLGLMPGQEFLPIHAQRFDRREFSDYITEKVLFESMPGLYLTGCLYWPKGTAGKIPMILNPHGHWNDGRFEMSEITRIPQRCVNFALHGMASFSFDMIGFGDSRQMDHHAYRGDELDLWNESLLSLQICNCLQALNFVWDLPEIDRSRIGSTGASGGGTQTFFLTALDDRVAASVPVNMISTTFQGSCVCEYATNLHIGISNIEIAAMMAPRPMLLAGSSGDWTYDLPTVTHPYLREIYALYGAQENVEYYFRDSVHGYQTDAQEAAYRWFAARFMNEALDDEAAREKPIEEGTLKAIRIFGEGGREDLPKLTRDDLFEAQKARKKEQIAHLRSDPEGLGWLRKALSFTIGDVQRSFVRAESREETQGDVRIQRELLHSEDAEIPLVTLIPGASNGKTLLFANRGGKSKLLRALERGGQLEALLGEGYRIACADLFLTGEYLRPWGASGRDFSRPKYRWCEHQYVTTYNYTDDALRIQDFIGVYRCLVSQGHRVVPAALGEDGALVATALPFLPGVEEARIDLSAFDGAEDRDYVDTFFLPGFLYCGGLETCLLLSGIDPRPLDARGA